MRKHGSPPLVDQAAGVVGMRVRDEHVGDLSGRNADRFEARAQNAVAGRTETGVDEHQVA